MRASVPPPRAACALQAARRTPPALTIIIRGERKVEIIRGERKVEKKENGWDTRSYGRFEERVRLPALVDPARVEAKLVGGVLSIDLPKAPEARPHKIAIKGD